MIKEQYSKIYEYLDSARKSSMAQKRKVASVFITKDFTILEETLAVNGILGSDLKIADCICEASDKTTTFNSVFHAEEQSIFKALHYGYDLTKLTLCVTYSPCYKCCRSLILSKCKNLVYFTEHPSDFKTAEIDGDWSPEELLKIHNVTYTYIPAEQLRQQSTGKFKETPENTQYHILYHRADLDGIVSGYLLKNWVQETTGITPSMYGYNYEPSTDYLVQLKKMCETCPEDKRINILFGDITPPLLWLEAVLVNGVIQHNKNKNVYIWIYDHHQVTLTKIASLESVRMLREMKSPNLKIITHHKDSAAKIIYDSILAEIKNFESSERMEYLKDDCIRTFINYISDYDTWQFTEFDEIEKNQVLQVHEYFSQFRSLQQFEKSFDFEDISDLLQDSFEVGKRLVDAKWNAAQQVIWKICKTQLQCNWNYPTSSNLEYPEVLILGDVYPDYYINTLIEKYYPTDTIWISWNYHLPEKTIKFSVRAHNKGERSVLEIVQYFGGGGHSKAGGFSLPLQKGQDFIFTLVNKSILVEKSAED